VADADAVRETLKASDIHAYIGYVPLHSSPMGKRMGYRAEDLPVTEEYAYRVLRMPFHNQLSPEDVDRVCDGVASWFLGRVS
jgi:dTDP-4-amino-4,6-dideoxygalactose transaminase